MDTIEYQGKTYERGRNGKWAYNNVYVSDVLNRTLNREFERMTDINSLSFEELWDKGALYKGSGDYVRAIRYFERALEIDPNRREIYYMLASMTSCYRSLNTPQNAIALFEKYKRYASAPLLTSVGAAYADLEDYVNAEACAKRAYAMTMDEGKPVDGELHALFGRLNKSIK